MVTPFIVFRDGVYRHEVMGWSVHEDEAWRIAEQALRAEPDDHHRMEIVELVAQPGDVSLGFPNMAERTVGWVEWPTESIEQRQARVARVCRSYRRPEDLTGVSPIRRLP